MTVGILLEASIAKHKNAFKKVGIKQIDDLMTGVKLPTRTTTTTTTTNSKERELALIVDSKSKQKHKSNDGVFRLSVVCIF